MPKTLHRQHADLKEEYRQASDSLLFRISECRFDELPDAIVWMQKDCKALVDWEAEHVDFLNRNIV